MTNKNYTTSKKSKYSVSYEKKKPRISFTLGFYWPLLLLLLLPISIVLFFIQPEDDWSRMIIRLISLLLLLRFIWSLLHCVKLYGNRFFSAVGAFCVLLSVLLFILCILLFIYSWKNGSDVFGIVREMSKAKKSELATVSSIIFGSVVVLYILTTIFSSTIIYDWHKYSAMHRRVLYGPWFIFVGLIMNLLHKYPR